MVRDDPLDPPAVDGAADAARAALGSAIDGVDPIPEGLNATYRIDPAEGPTAVLKAATVSADEELLHEPGLLNRVGEETAVPVPAVLGTVGADRSPLGVAYFLTEYREGRDVTDPLALTPETHERLVREAGRHLAAIHSLQVEGFGPLGYRDGEVVALRGHESWGAAFADMADAIGDALLGKGYTNDEAARFADREPDVRNALGDADPPSVEPSLLHGDYRPTNLVLSGGNSGPIVRAVLDFGGTIAGDGLFDLALAEETMVELPLSGTERGRRFRDTLREAYLDGTDTGTHPFRSDRYGRYRLYARARTLGTFDYWRQFARESDPDATAERLRAGLRDRLDAVR